MTRSRAIPALAAVVLTAATVCGCAPERPTFDAETIALARDEAETSPTVAKIGEEAITYTSFERRLNALPPFARARYSTPEELLEFLEAQVTMELMADAARREEMSRAPEVIDAVKETVAERAVSTELRRRLDSPSAAAEEDGEGKEIRSYTEQRRQAREEAIADLTARAEIAVDEQAFKRLRRPASPAAPPVPTP